MRNLLFIVAVVIIGIFTSCKGDDIELIPDTRTLIFDYRGGDTIFTIRCTDETMWYLSDKTADWCVVSPKKGKSGDIIEIAVSSNSENIERSTQLVLICATESFVIDVILLPKRMPVITEEQIIDLGLSVKWAGWNVGASAPEDIGAYYAWGETYTKEEYTDYTYSYYNEREVKYYNIGHNITATQFDVARLDWGDTWRIPTCDEIKELVNRCTWEWGTYKSVNGMFVTGPNGNSIFLPASGYSYNGVCLYYNESGYYWSASINDEDPNGNVCNLDFSVRHLNWFGTIIRSCGTPIRPVTR